MVTQSTTIINKLGLHARAASKFANTANRFASLISLEAKGKSIDGKSIMSIMLLAASIGTDITISADGEDEQAALDALITLIHNKFDEQE